MIKGDRKRKVTVYVDKVLDEWLESKALEGYRKGSLIRRALHSYRERELLDRHQRGLHGVRCGFGMRGCIRPPIGGGSYDPDEPDEGDEEAE